MNRYVPTLRTEHVVNDISQEPVKLQADFFHSILIGGDQLTCARVRGGQQIRENSRTGRVRLEGLIPVIEDWHARVCFMQVSMYL